MGSDGEWRFDDNISEYSDNQGEYMVRRIYQAIAPYINVVMDTLPTIIALHGGVQNNVLGLTYPDWEARWPQIRGLLSDQRNVQLTAGVHFIDYGAPGINVNDLTFEFLMPTNHYHWDVIDKASQFGRLSDGVGVDAKFFITLFGTYEGKGGSNALSWSVKSTQKVGDSPVEVAVRFFLTIVPLALGTVKPQVTGNSVNKDGNHSNFKVEIVSQDEEVVGGVIDQSSEWVIT